MQQESRPQVLVQLKGAELSAALPALEQGLFGLEVVEFASPQLLDGDWKDKLCELQAICSRLPGPLTMHGPFLDLSPASPEPRLRQLTKERYRQAIGIARTLGARYLVLHSQFNPNIWEPSYPKLWREGALSLFGDLWPEIKAAGTTVVLENMWDPKPNHLAELLRGLPPDQFAACLDVGHAHLHSPSAVRDWVETLGERLLYVHLSDNHGGWDEHLAIGQGRVDFAALLAALEDCRRQPWFVLEVKTWSDVQESLRHLGWSLS